MQVRVITSRYQEGLQGFPEDALRQATFGREVLSVSEHFFVHANVPHLTLVLSLGDVPNYENAGSYRPRNPGAPNPEDGLPDSAKSVYRALKGWRNETARNEGRPAYAIARNAQLAELAKCAPKTLAGIREIDGFGEAFCERYGRKVLELLAATPKEETAQSATMDFPSSRAEDVPLAESPSPQKGDVPLTEGSLFDEMTEGKSR